ncbi:YceI family protein [Portibacter lacus]|uniref:Lipid-binding protein n=1 Tax=Portibacter lacus TaxID=1099794 RepID=A0AA37SP97_9BACT|nr:YceI family protein [Portibacter lacus]GLR17462.1 lipid-binding protein [Portibacter lacus]
MKKLLLSLACLFLVLFSITGQEEINIDLEKSEVKWKGSHLFSFGNHYGIVKLKSGGIIKTDGNLVGGSFTIDMNTIANTDGDYSEMLVDHLKNEDFFDVNQFPTATLKIKKIEKDQHPHQLNITADLTIKGITLPIEFQANNENPNKLLAKFIINRVLWGINFGSPSITNVQDNIISDAIQFEVAIITK